MTHANELVEKIKIKKQDQLDDDEDNGHKINNYYINIIQMTSCTGRVPFMNK